MMKQCKISKIESYGYIFFRMTKKRFWKEWKIDQTQYPIKAIFSLILHEIIKFNLRSQFIIYFKMFIAAILCLLVLKISFSCQTQLNNYHDDYFYVSSNSTDCTAFNFIKCEYSSCYKAGGGIGNGNCNKGTVVTYYQWSTCLSSLCDMSDEPQTYQTIQNCYDANKRSFLLKLGLGLGFGLAFIVGVTITIIFCYCKHKNSLSWNSCCLVEKCSKCCNCCKRFPDDQSQNQVTIQMEKKVEMLT